MNPHHNYGYPHGNPPIYQSSSQFPGQAPHPGYPIQPQQQHPYLPGQHPVQPGYYPSMPHAAYYPAQTFPGQYPGHLPPTQINQPRPHTHIQMNPPTATAAVKPTDHSTVELKEWFPSANERSQLDVWFDELDEQHTGYVGGIAVVNFLKASNLSKENLRLIWSLVDTSKRGSLDRQHFYHVMRFVAIAMSPIYAGTTPSVERFNENLHHEFSLPTMSASTKKLSSAQPTPSTTQIVGLSAFDEMSDQLVSKSLSASVQVPQAHQQINSQAVHQSTSQYEPHQTAQSQTHIQTHYHANYPGAQQQITSQQVHQSTHYESHSIAQNQVPTHMLHPPHASYPFGYPYQYPHPTYAQNHQPNMQQQPNTYHQTGTSTHPVVSLHQNEAEEFSEFTSAEIHTPKQPNNSSNTSVISQHVHPNPTNVPSFVNQTEDEEFSDFAGVTVQQQLSTQSATPVDEGPFGNLIDFTPQIPTSSSNPSIALSREFEEEMEYTDFSSAPTTPSLHISETSVTIDQKQTVVGLETSLGNQQGFKALDVSSPHVPTNKLSVFDDLVESDLQVANEDWDDFAEASHAVENTPSAQTIAQNDNHQEIDLLGDIVELQPGSVLTGLPLVSDTKIPTDESFDVDFGDFHSVSVEQSNLQSSLNSLLSPHTPKKQEQQNHDHFGGTGLGMVFMFDDTQFSETLTPQEDSPPVSPHKAASTILSNPVISSHKLPEAIKFDDLAGNLLQYGFTDEAWQAAQYATLLEDLQELKHQKQIAVESDDLERAVQLKLKIQKSQSLVNEQSPIVEQHHKLFSNKTAVSSLDYGIRDDIDIVSSYNTQLGQMFQHAFTSTKLPDSILERILFLHREKRSYRLILTLYTSHGRHIEYWKKMLSYCLSTFEAAGTIMDNFHKFSSEERMRCLETSKFQQYIDAVFLIIEVTNWLIMTCEEAFVLDELVKKNKEVSENLFQRFESYHIRPFNVEISDAIISQPVNSTTSLKYCNLTLRPISEAKTVIKSGKTYLQSAFNLFRHLYPEGIVDSDVSFH